MGDDCSGYRVYHRSDNWKRLLVGPNERLGWVK
jgi:hypothetical protein